MAYQNARKPTTGGKAKGDARNTGAPGPTPPPRTKYKQPESGEKFQVVGYGAARNFGPSSADPGVTITSPLADDLRNVAAQGDGGDLLGRIAERGTARGPAADVELQSPQTRDVDASPYPTAHGMRNRSGEGAKVPNRLGESVFNPASIRKPGA